ncbi:MAG: hypothetical protein AAGC70_01915 [Pseudomonadota bacterium]
MCVTELRASLKQLVLFGAIASLAALAGGCATLGFGASSPGSGLRCVDDSPTCVTARRRALLTLRRDSSRAWVRQSPDARTYAAGVRLFAFRLEKDKLNCDELTRGVQEADGAPRILNSADAKSLTPAQISRGMMLSAEIGRELANERRRRCR